MTLSRTALVKSEVDEEPGCVSELFDKREHVGAKARTPRQSWGCWDTPKVSFQNNTVPRESGVRHTLR